MIKLIIDAILRLFQDPMSPKELDKALTKRAAEIGQALNWKESIVDLLKLLDLDSSIDARRKLALELGYTGTAVDGSADKNMWLHREVLKRVADHGIPVPGNLLS